MTLVIINMITEVLQAIILSYAVFHCMEKSKNYIKIIFLMILYFIIGQVINKFVVLDSALNILIIHTLTLLTTIGAYKNNIKKAVAAHSMIYIIFGIYSIIFSNLIFEDMIGSLPIKYIYYEKILVQIIPLILMIFGIKKFKDNLKQIHNYILHEKFSNIFLIISYFMDCILMSYVLSMNVQNLFLQNIVYILFSIFCMVIIAYFGRIKKKSEQIYQLNEHLEIKNNELRKIKHDYGAQISYLYGLCLMQRFDDLKKSLKDIISNNDATPTAVSVTNNEKSLLAAALRPAIDKGIHVIIEDKCDFSLINMNELDLFRVVSNIVNNAVKALNGKGLIIAKSYEYLGNVIIKIENNGPKIPEHHLRNIFNIGFTTKENSDKNHGYGLSIASDLVKKNNGKIKVRSNETVTEFKIILPIQ